MKERMMRLPKSGKTNFTCEEENLQILSINFYVKFYSLKYD